MVNEIKRSLRRWNDRYNERAKLQHALLVLSSIGVLISGLVALIDASLGHDLVCIFLMGYVLVVVNWVTWSLLSTTLLQPLTKRKSRK